MMGGILGHDPEIYKLSCSVKVKQCIGLQCHGRGGRARMVSFFSCSISHNHYDLCNATIEDKHAVTVKEDLGITIIVLMPIFYSLVRQISISLSVSPATLV